MGDYLKWKQLDKINDEKPFSPNQIRDELKVSTDNWAKEKGVFKYGYEEEAILAQKYLSKHGYNVEYNSEDNNLFPDNIVYNVWFSKQEIPDGFESGEWLNEGKKKKKKYSLSPIFPNPEDSVKFFNHVMGADKNKCKNCNNENTEATAEAEATASEGAAVGEALDENKVYGLFIKVIDSNNKTIKDWNRIDAGSKKEMDEKRKHLEEVSPEDSYHNFNKYKVSEIKEDLDESIKLVSKLTVKIDSSEEYEDFINELDEIGIEHEDFPDTNRDGDPSVIVELYGGDNAKEFLNDVNKIIKDLGIKVEKLEEKAETLEEKKLKYNFCVYELDEDGDELDAVKGFNNLEDAKEFALKQEFPTHIVYVPEFDPDDDPDTVNQGEYEDFEVVWESTNESLNEELEAGDCVYHPEKDEYYYLKAYKPNKFELYTYSDSRGFEVASPRFIDKNSPFYNKLKLVNKNANPEFKEALNEELVFSDVVKSAYNHFRSDLGMIPTVDDILDDITSNYDGYSDIQDTLESYAKWHSAVAQELNRQGLEVLTEDIKEEKSSPKIFYKCAINDEYFVSIYPEKIKEKKPKNKNVWILEWKDNGDFEDCENGKKYYSNNVVGDKEALQEYLKIKGQEKITVLENLEEAHRDDPEVVKLTNEIKNDIEKLDDLGIDTKNIEEDIEKHDTLNPKLFDENEELKPEIKEAIQKIVNEFVEGLNEDGIRFTLKDVVLVGSNVSYNYTKDSDLDVHLIADSSGLECPGELYPLLYSAYRSIFNKNYDITIKGIPTEIYVEMDENKGISNGVYSLNNGWIKHPEQTVIPDLDQEAFDNLFDEWEDKYFDLLDSVTEVHNTELEEEVDAEYEKYFDEPDEDDIKKCKDSLEALLEYSKKNEFAAGDTGACWVSDSLEYSDAPVRNDKQGYLTMLMAALELAKENKKFSVWKSNHGYYGDKDFLVIYTTLPDKEEAARSVIDTWNEDSIEPIEFDCVLLNPEDYLQD